MPAVWKKDDISQKYTAKIDWAVSTEVTLIFEDQLVTGYFTAQISCMKASWEEVMSPESAGHLAMQQTRGGRLFHHKNIHKRTWCIDKSETVRSQVASARRLFLQLHGHASRRLEGTLIVTMKSYKLWKSRMTLLHHKPQHSQHGGYNGN